MLTLILLRHAKAELGSMTLPDDERALAPRGRKDAPRIGAFLTSAHLIPDLVLCSTAQRARETWALVAPALAAVDMQFESQIYEASSVRLLAIVRRTPPPVSRLMLVGHNPGLEDLAHDLVQEGDPTAMARLDRKFPTSGLAVLTWPHDTWAQITPRSARLATFTAPAYLAE